MCSEWRVIMKRFISLDKLIVICLFLSVVPLLIATISIYFMPNEVPMHYNALGIIDRWGSSNEMLFIGALFVIFPLIMSVAFYKIKMNSNTKLIGLAGSVVMSITFIILQVIFTAKIFSIVGDSSFAGNSGFWLSFGITVYGLIMVVVSAFISLVPLDKLFNRNFLAGDIAKRITRLVTLITGVSGVIICLSSALLKNIYSLIPFAICILLAIASIIVMWMVQKKSKISGSSEIN